MIPAALGNILGGSLFCGVYYWYMYLAWDGPVKVDGGEYSGPVMEHHHHHPHWNFSLADLRRKSTASTDEESKIGSRRVSHS